MSQHQDDISFVDLNEDIWIKILSYIPTNQLFRIQTVNKTFSKISEHDELWRQFYKQELALLHTFDVLDVEKPVQSNFKQHLKQIYEKTISQIDKKFKEEISNLPKTKYKNTYYTKDEILNYEPPQDFQQERFNVAISGDGCIGKTSMFIRFAMGKFPNEYIPTVFDQKDIQSKWNSKYYLDLYDTAGQEYGKC